MIKKLGLIKDEEEKEIKLGSQFGGGWGISNLVKETEEDKFQKAYKEMAKNWGLNPDPYAPEHYYDYKTLWKETGRLEPDTTGHFPSKYKLEGHPRTMVNGINTVTGERGSLAKQKEEDILKPPKIKKLGLIKEEPEVSLEKPSFDWIETEKQINTMTSELKSYKTNIEKYDTTLTDLSKQINTVQTEFKTNESTLNNYINILDELDKQYKETPTNEIVNQYNSTLEKYQSLNKIYETESAQINSLINNYNSFMGESKSLYQEYDIKHNEINKLIEQYNANLPTIETKAGVGMGAGIGVKSEIGKTQPQIKESGMKDIWDAFRLGASGMLHKTKQYFNSVLPNMIFRELTVEEVTSQYAGMTESQVKKLNEGNKKKRESYIEKYNQANDRYVDWLRERPELQPRKEWEKGVIETIKGNPKILTEPAYWGYVAAQSAAFTIGVMGTVIATTAVTGNPLLGLATGVLVATPMQTQELYEDLIANGATPEQATKLAIPIGGLIASVEVMGDLPILASVSAPFKKLLFRNINKAVANKVGASLIKRGIKTFATIEIAETIEEVVQLGIQEATVKTVNENINMLENIPETVIHTMIATVPFAMIGLGSETQIAQQLKKKITDVNYQNAVRVQLEEAGILPRTELEVLAYELPKMSIEETKEYLIKKGFREEHLTPEFMERFMKRPEIQELARAEGAEPGLPEFLRRKIVEPTEAELTKLEAEKPLTAKQRFERFVGKIKEARAERLKKAEIPEVGKKFVGKAFRAETIIPEHGAEVIAKMKTAQEKLDYDYGTTGNYVFKEAGKLAENLGIDLTKVPIEEMMWVAKDIETAEKYGEAKEYKLPEDTIILAKDDGGSLILKNFDKYEEPVTVSLEEEGKVEALWAGEKIGGTSEEITEGTKKAFDKTAEFLYNKPFEDLKKSELNKVLETSKQPLPDSTGEYINKIGTPAKGLELRATADEHARFIFGGYEKGLLTDSHLLVLDKTVSKAILTNEIEKYKKARVKEVQTEEISYKEAQKIVDKEIEGYKKRFVKEFPDTEKIVSKEDIEKSTSLGILGHQKTSDYTPTITYLTDGKIQIAIDTNKLAFLNKYFPNAEIKATGELKPILFMEKGKLKAVVMPMRVDESPFKITGEPTIRKPAKEITPGVEVKPTIKKISKIKPTIKPTITPEEKAERGRLTKFIHTIKSVKGLTDKEYTQIKQRIKAKFGIPWIHLPKLNLEQLRDVAKAMERARPKRIGWQKVITPKTENKIQSLKDSLVEKYQMTEEAYQDTLKDLGIYKEPRYIDGKHFITEEKGKELIYRLIDESNILRITEPLRIALEKNPEVKKLADIIDRRVKLEGERTLKDPSDLNSARSYFQILGMIADAPFFTLYQDFINTHLENRASINHLIKEFDEYKDIIKDEKELKKVEDWILAKSNLKGRPETPVNITPKEIEMAKKIEGILKDYQSRARTEKFLDNLEHPEDMPQYLKYKKEIDKAKDIYESKGYDDLVEYMKTQEWGTIKSGYDPLQVLSAKVRIWKAKGLSLLFGKEHIKVRKDIEYKEQDANIITRLFAYKRQMDNLSTMSPKVRGLITLANKNLDKFKNPKRVKNNLQLFFRELKGYDRTTNWFERGINRLYSQAMIVIIMGSPALSFRNLGQNFGLGHDKAMLIDPRNKKLTPDQIDYLDTYVQQAEFMRVDWFLTGEKPLVFPWLINFIKKVNLYPRSDIANRHWGFWGKINQVRMAFADIDKNSTSKQISKAMEKAKFSDFSLLEQKRALEILSKDGKGEMEKYIARVYVDDVHFLYERAQRSLAEMGKFGKVFGNLMLFPRAYWEKLTKASKKMTGRYVPAKERARAFKVLASVLIGGALVGVAFTKTTGRRKNPYDPLVLLAYEPGGLLLGNVEALSDAYTSTIMAVRGDERAIASLATEIPKLADHFLPFYSYALRGYEAFLADPLVNKNIDTYALKKLRMMVDKEYELRGGIHSVERNAIEKWQYFISGAGVDIAIAERKKKEREAEPIEIGKPKIPKLGIPTIGKPGIKKLSPIKKF